MTDYETIQNLFSPNVELEKYTHKRWVKIHPTNNNYTDNGNGLTQAINYNCKTVADKLINYQDGYILVSCRAARTALAAKDFAPKSSAALVDQAIVRLNNKETDNIRYHYVFNDILNSLEYSHDYSKHEEVNMYALNTNLDLGDNIGHTTRKSLINDPANNRLDYEVKLPLKYVSPFFRALDFPVLNNEFDFDITYRLTNSIARDAGDAITVTIRSTVLYLPIVELPVEYQSKLYKGLTNGMTKEVNWHKLVYRTFDNENGEINKEIVPSINGIRRLYVIAVPAGNWNNQTTIESTSDTTLTNCNVVIDSEDFYAQDLTSDIELYTLTSDLFNMQGKDPNTGPLLSYSNYKNVNRYYGFDLSRQKVFESDPRKAQSLRFKGTINQASNVLYFIAQAKTTSIDFKNPYNTTTV